MKDTSDNTNNSDNTDNTNNSQSSVSGIKAPKHLGITPTIKAPLLTLDLSATGQAQRWQQCRFLL